MTMMPKPHTSRRGAAVVTGGDGWGWSRRCWHPPRGPAELRRKGTAPLGRGGSLVTQIEGQVGFRGRHKSPRPSTRLFWRQHISATWRVTRRAQSVWGLKATPLYNSRSVSSDRVSRAAWSSESRTLSPLPALGAAFYYNWGASPQMCAVWINHHLLLANEP